MPTAIDTLATPERLEAFLEVLAWCGNITEAARCVGVSRSTPYRWREADPTFAIAWDQAIEASNDILEMEARRRALGGVEEPVFYKGEVCGQVTKYSDTLLMFLLNGNRPDKFKRRHEHTGEGGKPIKVAAGLTPEAAEAMRRQVLGIGSDQE